MSLNHEADLETTVYDLAWKLRRAGIESARLEARMLVAHVLGVDYKKLSDYPGKLTEIQQYELENLLAERLAHKPLDKVIGRRGFYKYNFEVSENVLSPRPDTEILVEAAVRLITKNRIERFLDLGTGSGCILLSLAADCPHSLGVGFDKSGEALEIAARNAYELGVADRITLIQGTWYNDQLAKDLQAPFPLIVSNPPYIPSREIDLLDPEVRDYDPRIALDGGKDGLSDYRQLARIMPELLESGGYLLLEVGENQARLVQEIFSAAGLRCLEIIKDLGGIERCVILKKEVAIK